MTELHVIPDERTTWRVYEAGRAAPLSEHTNTTDAALAALARVGDGAAARVLVYDRYHRSQDAARLGLLAQAQRARAARSRRD